MKGNLDCAVCGAKIQENEIKDRIKVTVGKLTYTPETWDICVRCRQLPKKEEGK